MRKTREERFWALVQKGDGCWIWTGSKQKTGHGFFWCDGESQCAHRISWQIHYGPIPNGLWVLHHCDNGSCVRPDHLFLGTAKDNTQDAAGKGRMSHGERVKQAKLNPAKVREIRRRYSEGDVFQWQLAADYGVTQSTIGAVVSGRAWRHVKEDI